MTAAGGEWVIAAVLMVDASEVVCLSCPSLPSLAATSHIVPIAPKPCPSAPEGAGNRYFLCPPLTNSGRSTVSFTSRSRRNVCARCSGVHKLLSASPYHLFWLGVLDKPVRQMGLSEGSQKCKGLIFHWHSPILCFFQLCVLRQS